MKTVYTLLVGLLLAVNAYGQYTDVPYTDDPLLPNRRIVLNLIKTERVYAYTFGNKGIKDSALVKTKVYSYNAQNQLISEETSMPGSKVKAYVNYLYDKYSEVVKLTQVSGKRVKGRPDSTMFEFQYDTLGKPRFIYKYEGDTSGLRTTEKIYNSKNQLITVQLKIGDGEFFTIRYLTYDENGNLARLEFINGDGNTTGEYAFTYDEPARKRMIYIINNDKRKLYEAYTYTVNNDHAKMEQYNYVDPKNIKDAAPSQVTKYYYDERGLLANEVTYAEGNLVSFTKHFYTL